MTGIIEKILNEAIDSHMKQAEHDRREMQRSQYLTNLNTAAELSDIKRTLKEKIAKELDSRLCDSADTKGRDSVFSIRVFLLGDRER